jgi:integrase
MSRTGTGHVYQRGGVWWIDYSHRGKRHRESSESTRRADATALLKKRLGEIGTGTFVGPSADRITLDDMAEGLRNNYRVNELKSLDRAEGCIKRLAEHLGGDTKAVDLTADRLDRYVVQRQEDGAATSTAQRELAILRRMFTLAKRAGRISLAPAFPTLKINNARKGFLDGAELERVIGELPEPLRAVVRFAAWTGWRRGEILSRTWQHVDFDRGVIRLEPGETKNKEGREFPFGSLPVLRELLEKQRAYTRQVEKRTGNIVRHVFHRDGAPILDLRNGWDGACRRAGVPAAIFHDLRRTAVRNLERAGVSRSVSMKLTGHLTEAIFRRYAISDAAALAEGVEKLAKLHQRPVESAEIVPLKRAR